MGQLHAANKSSGLLGEYDCCKTEMRQNKGGKKLRDETRGRATRGDRYGLKERQERERERRLERGLAVSIVCPGKFCLDNGKD